MLFTLSKRIGLLTVLICWGIALDVEAADLIFNAKDYQSIPHPSIVDLNGDGWDESLGTFNSPLGILLQSRALDQLGLQKLFANGRKAADLRVVDFNGDGRPDIISITYSCFNDDPAVNTALLFINNGDGTFVEDTSFTAFSKQVNLRGHGESIIVADFDNDGFPDIYMPYYTQDEDQTGVGCPAGVSLWKKGAVGPAPSSHLLRNLGQFTATDGKAHFADVTASACLSAQGVEEQACPDLRDLNSKIGIGYVCETTQTHPTSLIKPEGVEAIDFNGDGLIDFYVAGRLFINQGNFRFTNKAQSQYGLSPAFDEGIKFLDWNNDGNLDIIRVEEFSCYPNPYQSNPSLAGTPYGGPVLYQFNPSTQKFDSAMWVSTVGKPIFPGSVAKYCQTYGVYVADLDNDGYEDVFVNGSAYNLCPGSGAGPIPNPTPNANANTNQIFLNKNTTSGGFELATVPSLDGLFGGTIGFGDIDRDGKIDAIFSGVDKDGQSRAKHFRNTTSVPNSNSSFIVEVLGPNGQRNQQGRVVRISPQSQPGVILTRVVESGSGYAAQSQYALLIGTRYPGDHVGDIIFPSLAATGPPVTVNFSIVPGKMVQIYQPSTTFPNGKVVTKDPPSPANPGLIFPLLQRLLDDN